jgi:hypothetical protein
MSSPMARRMFGRLSAFAAKAENRKMIRILVGL